MKPAELLELVRRCAKPAPIRTTPPTPAELKAKQVLQQAARTHIGRLAAH